MDAKNFDEKKLEYIWGEMSKEEEASFTEELKLHPEEAIDVRLQRRIIDQAKIDKQLEKILNDPGIELAKKEAEKAVKEYEEEEMDYICGLLSKEEEASFEEDLKRAPKKARELELKKKYLEEIKLGIQSESGQNNPGREWSKKEAEKAIREYEKKKRGE
jgi:hypothetical protein